MHLLTSCLVLVASALAAGAASALPPGAADRGFVDGANHHLGDTSFVARFGRPPGPADSESVRMYTHLVYVHDWLAARPATRPELAPRRAELLAHLADYAAKGTTPLNLHLPWRNPVFVDDLGNVCAVGYLIEQSAGRALVERIAARHRFDFLEDIDMPEVTDWVVGSGFTLTELASIQPGYQGPPVTFWTSWELLDPKPADGPWQLVIDGTTTRGAWKRGRMHGRWERLDAAGTLVGSGQLDNGSGTWTSVYPSGHTLARGPFVKDRPHGRWQFFHDSGALAAEGRFARGHRHGTWTFYQDAPERVLLARGAFDRGTVSGRWRHFDRDGSLAAETWSELHDYDLTWRLETPRLGGVSLRVAEGSFMADYSRIDRISARIDGRQRMVFRVADWDDASERMVMSPRDLDGFELTRTPTGWVRSGCEWSDAAKAHALAGRAHAIRTAWDEGASDNTCDTTEPVDPAVGAYYDVLLGTADDPRPWPAIVESTADTMTWYAEWPHVDPLFERVFATLGDRFAPDTFAIAMDAARVTPD